MTQQNKIEDDKFVKMAREPKNASNYDLKNESMN